MRERIKNGEFVVSIQLDPPRTYDIATFQEMLTALKCAGINTVDINSSRITNERIPQDSIHLASSLSSLGFDTIPHVTTRDSSISALASQIHSVFAWHGVTNFLVITGDPNEPAKAIIPSQGIFQTDSCGALALLHKHLRNNDSLKLNIHLGGAVNQNEADLEREKKRIKEKISAGADFFMSQPVFDEAQAMSLLEFYKKESSLPLLVGIWPLMNRKMVDLIREEKIIGVRIPEEVYQEVLSYPNDDTLHREELARAERTIAYVRKHPSASGVYIVAPARNPLLLIPLIKKLVG